MIQLKQTAFLKPNLIDGRVTVEDHLYVAGRDANQVL